MNLFKCTDVCSANDLKPACYIILYHVCLNVISVSYSVGYLWQQRRRKKKMTMHSHGHHSASHTHTQQAEFWWWSDPVPCLHSCSHLLHAFTLMSLLTVSQPPCIKWRNSRCSSSNKQTFSSWRWHPRYWLSPHVGALYLNLSTSASSTRKSLFCTSLWIFRISSSSRCLCFLFFSFSGGKEERKWKKGKVISK